MSPKLRQSPRLTGLDLAVVKGSGYLRRANPEGLSWPFGNCRVTGCSFDVCPGEAD